MKNSATSFKFWIGPGALLALVMAVALTVDARAEDTSTPGDDCVGASFCESDSQDGVDGSLGQDQDQRGGFEEDQRDNNDGSDQVGEEDFHNGFGGRRGDDRGNGRGGFRDGRNDGRHGPRPGGRDGFCTDPNPYDPRDPDCRDGRPGRPGHGGPTYPPPYNPGPGPGPGNGNGGGREFVTERLIVNRPVRFESLEINMMLGRLEQQLRGYELTGFQVLLADGGGFRPAPGGRQSDLSLIINGRVEDSVRVIENARRGSGLTAYNLRPYNSVNVGFRGERIQLAVQGDVFVSEIQLSFRRIR